MRNLDWPQALSTYVESRRTRTWEWGRHDCCRFATGAVEAMTGSDPLAAYDYNTEEAAAALISAAGSLEALVTAALGSPLPSVLWERRGDVLLAGLGNGDTVGVCLGERGAYAAASGFVLVPVRVARLAWRVGPSRRSGSVPPAGRPGCLPREPPRWGGQAPFPPGSRGRS